MHSGRCLCFGPSFQWSDNVKLGFDNLLRSPSHQTQLHGQARNVLPWLCGCRLISIFFLSLISTPWYRVQREVNFIALYSCLIRNNQEPLCFGLILRNVVTRRFLLFHWRRVWTLRGLIVFQSTVLFLHSVRSSWLCVPPAAHLPGHRCLLLCLYVQIALEECPLASTHFVTVTVQLFQV